MTIILKVMLMLQKDKALQYSMQLAMLKQLFDKKLISPFEYEKIKERIKRDYKVVSNIST